MSEQACICTNKGEMEPYIVRAYSFLLKHPELKGKEVSLFESESHSPGGGKETVSVSMPLDEIPRLHGLLKKCK